MNFPFRGEQLWESDSHLPAEAPLDQTLSMKTVIFDYLNYINDEQYCWVPYMKALMCWAITTTNKYEIWKSKFTLYEPLELVSLLITTWII